MTDLVDIPEPRGLPLLGNLFDINEEFPLGSMVHLADQHGEIYRLSLPGRTIVFVSSQALVHETCDEKRFVKSVNKTLEQVRNGIGDGLFTAHNEEENWGIAHRVLMPAFGPLSIRGMFDEMHDIASQLALKWARAGPDAAIDVVDDFTRLTLDTLALCSMGYRFNSYYSQEMHPFIEAMGNFLTEAGERSRRPPLPQVFYKAKNEKFAHDIDVMRKTAQGVLDARRAGNEERHDLLDAMLKGVDKQTGKKMTDESIMDNLITFLIAGHETTSGMLSFAFYQLLKHPEAYEKAQREVDEVIGKDPITVEHMSKLPYITAVLRETLRVNATIPLFTVMPREDTVIGGKYAVKAGEIIVDLLAKSHLDPNVHGDDALAFRPERMLDDEFNRLSQEFPDFWKPFGNGMRACIGRPFAWQEALLVMAMLLQNFNFVLDPKYIYNVKQTLTIKPKDLHMRAILRDGMNPTTLQGRLLGMTKGTKGGSKGDDDAAAADGYGKPITILYGSNSGTCEALAQRVATDAPMHGFRAAKVDCLDSAKGQLPTDQPVVIVTASYEGQPPDNAGHFVAWLQNREPDSLKDVKYTVFGCGHRDWVQTYHRVPKLVDEHLEKAGAQRVADMGLADASSGDIFTDFEAWEDHTLWPSLAKTFGVSSDDAPEAKSAAAVKVAVSAPRITTLRQDVAEATVISAQALTPDDDRRHIEIKLPEGMTYSAGDYLAILPINPRETVQRALRRFKLARDAHLEITTDGGLVALPTNTSIPANDVLGSYVELAQPATKRNILAIAEYVADGSVKSTLEHMAGAGYDQEVKAKRLSALAILERFTEVDLPIGVFLSMLPPMRVRQYSISSSPLWKPNHATVTYTVLNKPSLSGEGAHIGVATSYLASLMENDTLHVAIRPSHAAFSMPSNPETTPAIYIAAGSGLAPFRGFTQERAAMLAAGRKLAPAMFFFGCRAPDNDDLYRDEFDAWEKMGAVSVYRSYSRAPDQSEGAKHVDDIMQVHKDKLIDLWRQGAKVYVCGSRGVSESVRLAIMKLKMEKDGSEDEEGTKEWFESQRNVRYVADIFD
ncbi:cytochrome P450 [Emericellopsis atlantica]|uniref:Bifunctional cytochrome P450/NADPH--P450 reductase n=1 Tax=Emericellopsis atlantica TaxID=2614577 RepID=A0A9P7ZIS3_9HYPO|nr:cytochrome P450 [Emericellopsis atlantica]KAG9252258.1 cytochrome P450 [Emericellopsis atlantica]